MPNNNPPIQTNISQAAINTVVSVASILYIADLIDMKTALASFGICLVTIKLFLAAINKQPQQAETTKTRHRSVTFFEENLDKDLKDTLDTDVQPANN